MGTSGSTDGVICISEIALSEKDAFRTPVSLMSLAGAGNDIDWECVYFDKFEDDKLDKACKRPFGPSGLAWNRFDSCSGNANIYFFSYKKCWFGPRFEEKKGVVFTAVCS